MYPNTEPAAATRSMIMILLFTVLSDPWLGIVIALNVPVLRIVAPVVVPRVEPVFSRFPRTLATEAGEAVVADELPRFSMVTVPAL